MQTDVCCWLGEGCWGNSWIQSRDNEADLHVETQKNEWWKRLTIPLTYWDCTFHAYKMIRTLTVPIIYWIQQSYWVKRADWVEINMHQACWQLAADLLSSSRSKRCERILISAWSLQGNKPATHWRQLACFSLCRSIHIQSGAKIIGTTV